MKEILRALIVCACQQMGITVDVKEILIEKPKDTSHGDYASNIAMQMAKKIGKNPKEIANDLVSHMIAVEIDHIEVAGPGFLNFYLKKEYLFENIERILSEKDIYGMSKIGNHKKINLEYVSANPTGILHLGHARGASYGDSLARILTFTGYDVTREYYINDAGNQIANLEASIEARYLECCGLYAVMPEDGYHGKEIIDVAKTIVDEYGKNAPKEVFKEKGLSYLLDQIKQDLKEFRVTFDVWTSEKSIYDRGLVIDALERLKKSGNTYEEDGALWLKTSLYGDEKDRVLIKKDGSNTYFLPDIAYHLDKYKRGYDELINVFGADHHGYIPRLKAGIQMLGEDPDCLDVEIVQMVRLVRGTEEIKMSKRTGNAVSIQDLVEEVGLNATRYFFAMRSLDTQLDFDLELASKNSNENPVYYVEYAHARICSILNEYGQNRTKVERYETLESEVCFNLMSKLYEFQETVEQSAQKRAPHLLTNYVYDLATAFHSFYAHEKVLTDDKKSTEERIHLIEATSIVIRSTLELLGIVARTKM